MATIVTLQQECWNNALHCLGTAKIFQDKAKWYKNWIRVITAFGIIVPLCIGAVAATYGANSQYLIWVLAVAGPLSIFQLVLSGISLVYRWDDMFAYCLEAQTDNNSLNEEFQALAKNPPDTLDKMQARFDVINTKSHARTVQDDKVDFTAKDNRKGMRFALWTMQRQCATCGQVPNSLKATNCDTCGNF